MKFYAVTLTSLYEISDEKEIPVVEKIQLREGLSSGIKVGKNICDDGDIVYLSRCGIWSLEKKSLTKSEDGEVGGFGRHTTPVIGLFLKKNEAIQCFNSVGRIASDRRWKKQTLEVLAEIGRENPVFFIAKDKYNSFKYQ